MVSVLAANETPWIFQPMVQDALILDYRSESGESHGVFGRLCTGDGGIGSF